MSCHFKRRFNGESWSRPVLDGINLKSISEVQSAMLTSVFSVEEMEAAVSDCNGNKSPGLDGYNFSFIKKFWHILKDDICRLVAVFHRFGKLFRGCSASFIALIPKIENPSKLEDYMPISLVGCIYKILAKLLAARLGKVINCLISENQSVFVKGRNILDGVVVINELCDFSKRRRQAGLVFKVDFEKAYDSVSWEFLDYMLARMGFNTLWRKWVNECLSSSSVSILFNGSQSEEF